MKILISGANGLLGSALQPSLRKAGHEVNRLLRRKTAGKECCNFYWDPYAEKLDDLALEGVEAVIHLSGENIAGRWTAARKQTIRESRVQTTRFLSQTISNYEEPPKILICASAIGYYGDRGDELLSESSKFGTGFLADVVREWEAATTPASVKGIRVANLRIGVVLSRKGGALAKLLTPFKMGVGGIVGDGKQYWSWVTIDDLVGAIHHIINNDINGPVNLVAPNPVTNAEFTKTLGQVLGRPTILPLPKFAAKLALGEMADSLLLSSKRITPKKLLDTGYKFRHPGLREALEHVLENKH